jgi:hypothetical protein
MNFSSESSMVAAATVSYRGCNTGGFPIWSPSPRSASNLWAVSVGGVHDLYLELYGTLEHRPGLLNSVGNLDAGTLAFCCGFP